MGLVQSAGRLALCCLYIVFVFLNMKSLFRELLEADLAISVPNSISGIYSEHFRDEIERDPVDQKLQ
jgi:hypothetical protein